MKIKVTDLPYEEVLKLEPQTHVKPKKQGAFFRWLMKTVSIPELRATRFTYETEGMERLGAKEPCMILMNHSCFTDLGIVATLFAKRPYHIVCTNDGFVGIEGLMRSLGCIPTKKFIPDLGLVRDMKFITGELKESIVMFPEASYSFDGTETPLPESLGKCLKLLKVPVVMVKTDGAFLRDPLYNNLQKRGVTISAKVTYLLSPEEIEAKSADELNGVLAEAFHYNHFESQKRQEISVKEPFRADGLHRVLYKCAACGEEGQMFGDKTTITCGCCGKTYELLETGELSAKDGVTEFTSVPEWYAWERACVKEETAKDVYEMSLDVDILVLKDLKSMYRVGEGHLLHNKDGFHLTGCEGALDYKQSTKATYSLYADYFWYEIGDMISIGDGKMQYYCFPKEQGKAIVAKARLAAEELYKKSRT